MRFYPTKRSLGFDICVHIWCHCNTPDHPCDEGNCSLHHWELMNEAPRAVWAFLLRHPLCVSSRFVGFQCQWICDFPYGRMNKRYHVISGFCFEMFFLLSHLALEWSTHNFFIRYGNVFRTTFFSLLFSYSLYTTLSFQCRRWYSKSRMLFSSMKAPQYFHLPFSLPFSPCLAFLATIGCWSDVFVKLSRVMCVFFPSPEWLQLS